MNSFIPPLQNQSTNLPTTDGGIVARVENPPSGLESLKPGDNLIVELRATTRGLLLAALELPQVSKKIELSLQLTNNNRDLELPREQILPAQVRVAVQNPNNIELKILSINNQKPETFLRSTTAVQTENTPSSAPLPTGSLVGSSPLQIPQNITPNIPLLPLKAINLFAPLIAEASLPADLKTLLNNELSNLQLQSQIKNIGTLGTNQPLAKSTVSSPHVASLPLELKNTMQQLLLPIVTSPPADALQLARNFVSDLAKSLNTIFKQPLPAEVIAKGEINILRTSLGEIIPEQPLKIPLGSQLLLEVHSSLSRMVSSLPADKSALRHNVSQILAEILEPLKVSLPQSLQQPLINKIPAVGPKMLANIVAFIKASNDHKIETWLGSSLVDRLSLSGREGQDALARLETLLQPRPSETAGWRIIEIPFHNFDNLSRIRVAIRNMQDEEADNTARRKKSSAARFVVDTSFSKLGQFQLDGFAIPQDHRFDLIIRTQNFVSDDLCQQIMAIFRHSLSEVAYAGNIKINVKENFIKIGQDEPQNTVLPQGILI